MAKAMVRQRYRRTVLKKLYFVVPLCFPHEPHISPWLGITYKICTAYRPITTVQVHSVMLAAKFDLRPWPSSLKFGTLPPPKKNLRFSPQYYMCQIWCFGCNDHCYKPRKCLDPTTSKGPTKGGRNFCKIFQTYTLPNQSLMFYA